jgi:hypothetical protein
MRYLKGLAATAIAAGALLSSGAASVTAAELYSTGVTVNAGTMLHLSGSLLTKRTTDGNNLIGECSVGTVEGTTMNTAGTTVTVEVTALSWEGCTTTTDTLANGRLHIDAAGTVTGTSSVFTDAFGGVSCRYGTGAGTALGTLKTGKLAINAVINEQAPTSFICPDTTKWVANYSVTSPHDLTVE